MPSAPRICLLALLVLLVGCSDDRDSWYGNYELDFVDLISDADGVARHLITDEGDTLQLKSAISALRADTVTRYIAVLTKGPTGAILSSAAAVACAPPLARQDSTEIKQDSVTLSSIWRARQYINIILQLKAQEGRHTFGFIDQGITSDSLTGRHTLRLLLYHDRKHDVEAYPRTAYLSCPLSRYATLLHHGVDSIAFTVNEYGRGASTYYLPY